MSVGPQQPVALREAQKMPESKYGPLTRTDFVRYAGSGGDFNPIHHDEEFAKSAGMPSVFSMGMLQGGMLAQHVSEWLGLANIRSYRIRFTGQVWPGDTLTFIGEVGRVYEEGGETFAECSFEVVRQTGDVAINGAATAVVAPVS